MMTADDPAPRVDVLTQIVVARPLDEVAGYASNPSNAPEWYENIEAVEWLTDPPLSLGSRVAFVARFLGRRLAYTYEVVEFEPLQRLVMRTAEGPFPMETTYSRQETAGGTHMKLHNRGTPRGFSRIVAPLMSQAMRRANNNDLRRLKSLLEGS